MQPFPPCHILSHQPLYPAQIAGCACVCVCARVARCARGVQLEHLQSSPLASAQHMAEPSEGWVLSPGKVLTHRQERRAAPTPGGRGGSSWTSAPPPPFNSPPATLLLKREALEEPQKGRPRTGDVVEMNLSKLHERLAICRKSTNRWKEAPAPFFSLHACADFHICIHQPSMRHRGLRKPGYRSVHVYFLFIHKHLICKHSFCLLFWLPFLSDKLDI